MTQDTAIGGPHGRFPETRHSAIRGLQDDDAHLRRQSYEIVVAAYWKPVYKYLRLRWHRSNEEAKDLTQSFFANAMHKQTLARYDPAKATFRTYVRTCVDGFVLNALKHEARRKHADAQEPVRPSEDPETIFHREWLRSLFELAVSDLQAASDERGRQVAFHVFQAYDLSEVEPRPSYDDLADRFNITTATVTNYLAAMRRDLRKAVLARLRGLTATRREFDAEARALL